MCLLLCWSLQSFSFLFPLIITLTMSTRQAVRSLRQIANGRSFSTVVDDRMAMAAGSTSLPRTGNVLQDAMRQTGPRHDWSKDEIREIYKTPLMELAHQSVGTRAACALKLYVTDAGTQGVLHRRFHSPSSIQMCTLMNIKTGGCSEDCSYCAQSSRYNTGMLSAI